MMKIAAAVLSLAAMMPMLVAQGKEDAGMKHAKGEFTVAMKPVLPAPAEGLSRFSIDKVIHGDMEATTKGEMYAGGDFTKGAAGYVAIEVVTGTLEGKKGSFALMHMATMDKSGPQMVVKIVPGSGTGELEGISGTFTIDPSGGKHTWTMDYMLP